MNFQFKCFAIVLLFCTMWSLPGRAEQMIAVESATADALVAGLEKVRALRGGGDASPTTVSLAPGTYRLSQPLALDAAIVGEGLVIKAQTSRQTVLTGAVPLPAAPVDSPTQWRYDLPADWNGQAPRAILIDGSLQSAARHPNVGFARIVAAASNRRTGFRFDETDIPAQLDPQSGVCDLIFLHDWSTSRLPVQSVNHENFVLETVGPIGCEAPHYAIDHFEKQPRYWLEGHRSFADMAGEWYVDTVAKQLVLIGDTSKPAPNVQWPMLEQLLVAKPGGDDVAGDDAAGNDAAIQNLQLQGLVFTGTRFPMPAGGLAGAQATMHEPRNVDGTRSTSHRPMLSAAVQIEQGDGCKIINCSFQGLGNTGLWLGSRSRGCSVSASQFSNIGGNAINIGEDNVRRVGGKSWYQSAPDQVPRENQITHCEIRQCGRMLPGSVAIWAALNDRLEIAHNVIEDCPYTGISLGWMWNDSPSPAKDNYIHHNQIRRVMQMLSDGGGIYTLGRQPGSRLRANTITNVPLNAGRAESNGMFLDEGSTGFTISENVFRRIPKSPLRFHKAGQNSAVANHWELETSGTPAVRYNSTPETNVTVRDNVTLEREPRVYLIGNSLTWDTRPPLLSHYVDWHVDCGKSLQYIYENPANPCVDSSRLWPTALHQLQYDYLVVQPFYGTTLQQDKQVINRWLALQPTATLVIHTGWAHSATAAAEFTDASSDKMVHNAAYFERLIKELKTEHPQHEIRQTFATQTLQQIASDIESGKAPLKNLTDLYRDAIHMTHNQGRYLMHNLMRVAVDQPPSDEGFAMESQDPTLKKYLDALVEEVRNE